MSWQEFFEQYRDKPIVYYEPKKHRGWQTIPLEEIYLAFRTRLFAELIDKMSVSASIRDVLDAGLQRHDEERREK